jgi:hypothetical protein
MFQFFIGYNAKGEAWHLLAIASTRWLGVFILWRLKMINTPTALEEMNKRRSNALWLLSDRQVILESSADAPRRLRGILLVLMKLRAYVSHLWFR